MSSEPLEALTRRTFENHESLDGTKSSSGSICSAMPLFRNRLPPKVSLREAWGFSLFPLNEVRNTR